jgi:hypothetical protein
MQNTTTEQQQQQLPQATPRCVVRAERSQLRKAERRLMRHPVLSQEPAVLRWLQAEEQRVQELEASRG